MIEKKNKLKRWKRKKKKERKDEREEVKERIDDNERGLQVKAVEGNKLGKYTKERISL